MAPTTAWAQQGVSTPAGPNAHLWWNGVMGDRTSREHTWPSSAHVGDRQARRAEGGWGGRSERRGLAGRGSGDPGDQAWWDGRWQGSGCCCGLWGARGTSF